MSQPSLFSHAPKHKGPFLTDADHKRLGDQLQRVLNVLESFRGHWFTLRQLSDLAQAPEASTSARLRDLRRLEFGAHNIERKRVHNFYQYRLAE